MDINQVVLLEVATNPDKLILSSDLAAEFPVYIYLSEDRKFALHSRSMKALLSDPRLKSRVNVCAEGLSFLLQGGVVPPPNTIYKNVYVLGVGDVAELSIKGEEFAIKFTHQFPFLNSRRPLDSNPPQAARILELLAEATIERIDPSRESFLFHSAGKDSNSVALALAEAGWQNRVTLITHKSKGRLDESTISNGIAKKLGFKHRILKEYDRIEEWQRKEITEYFRKLPFPSADAVTLAYPLYLMQMPELKDANIIDGGGNDTYMGMPPTKMEHYKFPISDWLSQLHILRGIVNSEGLLNQLLNTRAEWCGISGFSVSDSKKLFPASKSTYPYWKSVSDVRRKWDYYDFKADVLTCVVASEVHIRKVRNFCDAISSNLVLPWANTKIASYLSSSSEQHLFDRNTLKNKIILRHLLKERLSLDSDSLGKLGFSYDFNSVVLENKEWVKYQITTCRVWGEEVNLVLDRLMRKSTNNSVSRESRTASKLIYRLFLISLWLNSNENITVY